MFLILFFKDIKAGCWENSKGGCGGRDFLRDANSRGDGPMTKSDVTPGETEEWLTDDTCWQRQRIT